MIPHGIDHARFSPGDEPREPFLLYPARAWPHKNHARLFEAFALLRRERPELRLVLTGGGHSAPLPDGVEVRGHVSADELVSLYRRAAALVFPSLYEGFGQPPLEAMACGCPVACSNAAVAARGLRRRRAVLRPRRRRARSRRPCATCSPTRRPGAHAGSRAPRSSRGSARPRAYEDVYRELL